MKITKSSILALLFAMAAFPSFGQFRNSAYMELGGAGLFTSLNYDIRLKKAAGDGLGFRAGIGSTLGTFYSPWIYTFPLGVNYVHGQGESGLLLGLNTTIGIDGNKSEEEENKKVRTVFSADVGYKFTLLESGTHFRATFTPIFNPVNDTLPIWFGIGVGYSWK